MFDDDDAFANISQDNIAYSPATVKMPQTCERSPAWTNPLDPAIIPLH